MSDTEVIWVAHYEIESDDGKGPFELITVNMPNSIEMIPLYTKHRNKIKYTGVYPLEHVIRRLPGNYTEIKNEL